MNPLVKKIFQEKDIQNIADVQDLMKDMFKDMVSLMLGAEMDEANQWKSRPLKVCYPFVFSRCNSF